MRRRRFLRIIAPRERGGATIQRGRSRGPGFGFRRRRADQVVERAERRFRAFAHRDDDLLVGHCRAVAGREHAGDRSLAARVDGLDVKALRDSVDMLKQKLLDCIVLLASGVDGKAALICGVNGAALGKVKAGEIVAHVAARIDGKGGGRPDMAQGGGIDSPALDAALEELPGWLESKLM